MNWPQEIAKMVFVKQELMEADKSRLWPYHVPAVAASQTRVAETEAYLGYQLDERYARFLLHADGWQGFYQSVDLFGSAELIGGQKMQLAQELLNSIEDAALGASGVSRDDVLPIAATTFDRDIFLLRKPNSLSPGEVVWFAGEEVDRFESFDDFFLAMIDYNREEVSYFKSKVKAPT